MNFMQIIYKFPAEIMKVYRWNEKYANKLLRKIGPVFLMK